MEAVILFVSAADEDAFITPEDISLRAYFLNVEIMLFAALDVFIDSYSATGTVTGNPGAVWLRRRNKATAACAEYGAHHQDSNQSYCTESDWLFHFYLFLNQGGAVSFAMQ